MLSLTLKYAKMPNSCIECRFCTQKFETFDDSYFWCTASMRKIEEIDENGNSIIGRRPFCKLEEVL